ncbi:crosslink repair DNA glycosylase YcaQ family protein [Nonomuraea sp. NPDC050404]|uniref:DNA glycosylase AlkZ-like family protein n=1 Tax=Nonomuraea sp. NPDC050404 TaxID=3155783 RepID=UPI0034059849
MSTKLTWPQILSWRLRRQFVSEADGPGAVAVARRLCGVQAQVASSARLVVAVRSAGPDPGEIDRALWEERTLVKTWIMRGTLHLLPADQLADYCAALSTLRFWEKGSWQRGHGERDRGDHRGGARRARRAGPLLALTEHLDTLAATAPSAAVHLLPGFDQYILAAPRGLAALIPPELKAKVSRQAGWISPVVVHEGRVAGVWEAKGGDLTLDLAAPVPRAALDAAVARMLALG